jgi:hypothetical protein
MHTVAFHEINKGNLELALKVGLKRTSSGDKGDDKEIIKTDNLKGVHEISRSKSQALLRVSVVSTCCYVSNLDLYDEVLLCLKRGNAAKAKKLADKYWHELTRLDKYDHSNGFIRPEIMVTYDIPATQIEIFKS